MREYNSFIIRLHLFNMLHQSNHFRASHETFAVQTDIKSVLSWEMEEIFFCHSFSTSCTSSRLFELSDCACFTKYMQATGNHRILNIIHANQTIFQLVSVYLIHGLSQKNFRNFIVLLWNLHSNLLLTINDRLKIILWLFIVI